MEDFGSSPSSQDLLADGPQVVLRQAEWDRQIETLDQREIELHQTQLKLVRAQTTSFMHDLSALRQDVVALQTKQDELTAGLASAVRLHELREHFAEHDASQSSLHSRLRGVEACIAPLRDELEHKLETQRVALAQEHETGHKKLMDLVVQHAEDLAKVTSFQQEERWAREQQNDRLERLERERSERFEALQAQFTQKMTLCDADLLELREIIGGEKMAREAYHGSIHSMQESIRQHFADEKSARELQQGNLGEVLERRLAEEECKLQAQHASLLERLDYLERTLGNSSSRQTSELHERLERVAAEHRELSDRAAERHEKELKRTHERLEQLSGRFGEHQEKLEGQALLRERLASLEQVLNDSAGQHAEAVTTAHRLLEQLQGRMAEVEKSGASLDELQKAHMDLADDIVARRAQHVSLAERVEYLERAFGNSADMHGAELEALKSTLSKHSQDFEGLRGSAMQHSTVQDRLNHVERVLRDTVDAHAQELKAAQSKLDLMHGRIAVCEASTGSLTELKRAQADLSGDRQTLQAHHASLKERVADLENSLGDCSEKHSSELEAAHGRLELLQARLVACEKQGSLINELQKLSAIRSSEDMGRAAELESLQERLEYLESLTGDAAGKHAKELEGLRASHAKHVEEIRALKASGTHHATWGERLAYLEQLVGDSSNKHSQELAAAQAKLESVHARLAACEQHGLTLADLRKSHSSLCTDKASLDLHHSTLKERVDYIEGLLGDSADKHEQALDGALAKLEQLMGRVSTCERHCSAAGELHKAHGMLANEKVKLETEHATLKEKVDYLETLVGDSAERHAAELEALKAAHSKHTSDSKATHSRLGDLLSQEKDARDVHHASMQERLNYLEGLLGDSADKHEKHIRSLEAQKALHAKLSGDLKAVDQQHAGLAEKLHELERAYGEAAEKQLKELASTQAKLEQVQGRLVEDRAVREAHAMQLDSLRKVHEAQARDAGSLETQHSAVMERLDFLEKLVGDSVDKHARELEAVKVFHTRLASESKALDGQHSSLAERLEQAIREKDEVHAHHTSLAERVDYLESTVGDSAERHSRELEAMREAYGRHARDVESLRNALSSHASMEERLEYLENALGDSADKHNAALASAHSKLEAFHSRLLEESAVREAQHGTLHEERRAHEAHVASVQERLNQLEKLLGDHGDRHARELDKITKGRDTKHATLEERLNFLEQTIGDNAEKYVQDNAALHLRLDQLHTRFTEERAARDSHQGSLQEQLSVEKDARDARHASLTERVQYLETTLGDSCDKHTRELELHKAAHHKLLSDFKARDAHHSSLVERLGYLEKSVGDNADKHAKSVEAALGRVDQLYTRLSACERQGNSIVDLQRSFANLATEKTQLDAQQATLKERVDFLETTIGDSVEKHSRALDALRKEQIKLSGDTKVRHSQLDVHHSSVNDRLAYLEKALGDSADKHQEELATAHSKIEQMHGRLERCEANNNVLSSLKQANASLSSEKEQFDSYHSTLSERLDYLEKVLADSQDRQTHSMSEAHRKIEQVQTRLAEERSGREGHHAQISDVLARERATRDSLNSSVAERLEQLEGYIGQSSRELQSQHGGTHARLGALEQRLGDELAELREVLSGEKQLRAQQQEAHVQRLEGEKQARELHERAVQSHLTGERQARSVHEQLVQEQLGHERSARERQHEHLQQLIAREREAREERCDAQQLGLQREAVGRESMHKDLCDALAKERRLREEHHGAHTELLAREKAARRSMEELLSMERSERSKFHDSMAERIEALQRSMGLFDTLLRKELEERLREHKRLWEAIDNHTHDLSTQIVELDEKRQEREPAMVIENESVARSVTPTPPAPARPVKPITASTPVSPVFAWSSHSTTAPSEAPTVQSSVQPPVHRVSLMQQPLNPPGVLRIRSPVREVRGSLMSPQLVASHVAKVSAPPPKQGAVCLGGGSLEQFRASGGSIVAQLSGGSQARARSPTARDVHIEQITCGHTRFPGEPHHNAEVTLDG